MIYFRDRVSLELSGCIIRSTCPLLIMLIACCGQVHLLENANECAIHGKRVTIMPKDISLAKRIENNPLLHLPTV